MSTLSPYYHGKEFVFDLNTAKSVLSHVGYLTELLNYTWINPVFWTLGIEFQYYLFIGMFYLFITNKIKLIRIASVLLLFLLSFIISDKRLLFYYLPLFTPGIICFLYASKNISTQWLFFLMTLNIIIGIQNNGLAAMAACFIAFVSIFGIKLATNKIATFLGNISFSLYLTHGPVCVRILNLSENFIKGEVQRSLFIFFLLAIAIIVAYFFYKLVEKPFLVKSKKFIF